MGDVAIIDVSATRLNEDGTAGDEIFSCKQKGKFSTITKLLV